MLVSTGVGALRGGNGRICDLAPRDGFDLRSFGAKSFEDIDFSGVWASCQDDGRFLRTVANGDRATDLMADIGWISALQASKFLPV